MYQNYPHFSRRGESKCEGDKFKSLCRGHTRKGNKNCK